MAQAQEEFSLAGGWDVDKAIQDVLNGLGFSPDQVRLCMDRYKKTVCWFVGLLLLLLTPSLSPSDPLQ